MANKPIYFEDYAPMLQAAIHDQQLVTYLTCLCIRTFCRLELTHGYSCPASTYSFSERVCSYSTTNFVSSTWYSCLPEPEWDKVATDWATLCGASVVLFCMCRSVCVCTKNRAHCWCRLELLPVVYWWQPFFHLFIHLSTNYECQLSCLTKGRGGAGGCC